MNVELYLEQFGQRNITLFFPLPGLPKSLEESKAHFKGLTFPSSVQHILPKSLSLSVPDIFAKTAANIICRILQTTDYSQSANTSATP